MNKKITDKLAQATKAFEKAFEAYSEARRLNNEACEKAAEKDDWDTCDNLSDEFEAACSALYELVELYGWQASSLQCWDY